MPNGKKTRGRKVVKKSKVAPKKYSRAVARPLAGANGSLLPQRASTILKYSQRMTATSTTGVMYEYQFKINSVFDPDYTGGGHQPLGHDQLYTFYNRYRVDSVDAKVVFHKSTDSCVAVVGLLGKNGVDTQAASGLAALIEQSQFKYKTTSYGIGASNPITLKRHLDCAQITGVTKEKYRTDDVYQAIMGSSPSEEIMLDILMVDLAEASTLSGFFEIELHYNVTFYDPKNLAQS